MAYANSSDKVVSRDCMQIGDKARYKQADTMQLI